MKVCARSRSLTAAGALVALAVGLAWVATGPAGAQDPNLKPAYGVKKLAAGFEPDPFTVKIEAGGDVKQNNGGVTAHVAKAPDFRLNYTAGKYPLTFKVKCKQDTTLLVNLPDGTWLADDDGGGFPNPKITIARPKSGQYDIWVGTLEEGTTPPAVLIITELKE